MLAARQRAHRQQETQQGKGSAAAEAPLGPPPVIVIMPAEEASVEHACLNRAYVLGLLMLRCRGRGSAWHVSVGGVVLLTRCRHALFLHQQVQCAVKEASSPTPEMLQQAVTLSGSPGEGSVSSAEGPADEEAAAPQADQQPEQPARGIKPGTYVPQHTQHLAPSATTLPIR